MAEYGEADDESGDEADNIYSAHAGSRPAHALAFFQTYNRDNFASDHRQPSKYCGGPHVKPLHVIIIIS